MKSLKNRRARISHKHLLRIALYHPQSGLFASRIRRPNLAIGAKMGTINRSGYVNITIGQTIYSGHRLAWFYMTKRWPKHQVDHRDGVRSNNAWTNLRAATNAQNLQNSRNYGTYLKGVRWVKDRGYWCSTIYVAGRPRWLGRFETEQAAHEAYVAAAKKHFGEFARAA